MLSREHGQIIKNWLQDAGIDENWDSTEEIFYTKCDVGGLICRIEEQSPENDDCMIKLRFVGMIDESKRYM